MRKNFDIEEHRLHMRQVRTEDTEYEKLLREFLKEEGYQEDDNRGDLPFRPDIVLKDRMIAIFMHGCLWHRHPGCRRAYDVDADKYPDWIKKFADNLERDEYQIGYLRAHGWRVLVVWECALNAKKRRVVFLPEVIRWIEGEELNSEIPSEPPLPK
jgi:DNA mismatch endonuclease (patch repair protein)